MLALRDEETFLFLLVLAVAAVAVVWIRKSMVLKQQKLRILESALQNPQLDEHTKRQLLTAFNAAEASWSAQNVLSLWGPRLLFVAGWVMMFGGVGTLLFGSHYDQSAGGIIAFVGFGVLSIPIALRELEARRAARP